MTLLWLKGSVKYLLPSKGVCPLERDLTWKLRLNYVYSEIIWNDRKGCSYTGYLSLECVLTAALTDTSSSLVAQIHVAMKANSLATVVLLNMCDKRELNESYNVC